jgi:Tfp pilus assembly protein PilV
VRKAQARLGGTTLVELLVAVVFIGICVSSLIACVETSNKRDVYARRRILMLAQARASLEASRAAARTAALTPGVTTANPVTAGFTGTASLIKTITLASGYSNLYKVNVQINWSEPAQGMNRADSLVLETWLRAPDA